MRRRACWNLDGLFVLFALAACASKPSTSPAAQPPVGAKPAVETVEPAAPTPQSHLEMLVAKCKSGDANSCYDGAGILSQPNASDDDNRLRADLEFRGCELGHGSSCNDYGAALANGLGVDRDTEAAARYFGKACDLGNQFGCMQFAGRLREGRGIEKDIERARKLYKQACEKKDAQACHQLGDMLVDSGATQERTEAASENGLTPRPATRAGERTFMVATSMPIRQRRSCA